MAGVYFTVVNIELDGTLKYIIPRSTQTVQKNMLVLIVLHTMYVVCNGVSVPVLSVVGVHNNLQYIL